jgi:hypothetical protein
VLLAAGNGDRVNAESALASTEAGWEPGTFLLVLAALSPLQFVQELEGPDVEVGLR